MGTLDGKVALITGAGQGVGQGIALALAGQGANVAVVGRTVAKLEDTCALLREIGVRAEPFGCDVMDTAALPGLVTQVVETFGGLDILVNNAYSGRLGALLSLDDEGFQQGFLSGPFATFALMKAAHPFLKQRDGSSIINLVTSAMVRWDQSGYGAYAACKVAVESLTRTAASEWGSDGIRVNCIAPLALSPALAGWIEARPREAEAFLDTVPLGRVGDCHDDIGRGVLMLVGPDARYLTGATIPLDGGQARF
ncbi:SDR family oxidoreductase [Nocardioides sp. JQ2195]|uniref:SDR family NAD(P)-dependent oxidoreductase n=1 Tax=Nocardioides sp. JQ2195 TaxID=2592334 RepID=UPI00143E737C|nr:SDR family oxidoreductase [Nocardioides sp. JQ2195]QIX26526.1 SDR family oxidoreductase [Nocardioides sp. JQ2195]